MKNIFFLIIILFSFSCLQPKENSTQTKIEIIKSKCSGKPIPKILNVDSIVEMFLDEKYYKYHLIELDSTLKSEWLDDIVPLTHFKGLYGAYFLYFIDEINNNALITVFCETDNYSSIILLSIDQKLNLIDRLEISGGSCGGVYEDSKTGQIIWCPEKYLSHYTDSTFQIIQLKKASFDYEKSGLQIDSSISDYYINDSFKFVKSQSEKALLLKKFYSSYIIENSQVPEDWDKINNLKKQYCTTNFLAKIEKTELEADPFLDVQDYNEDWINTLEIKEVGNKENPVFSVCFKLDFDESNHCVKVNMKQENGNWKIDNVSN